MMKNKLIYLISVLLVTVVSFSCSDDDDENNDKDLIGTWNYSGKAADIHFELEYNGNIDPRFADSRNPFRKNS